MDTLPCQSDYQSGCIFWRLEVQMLAWRQPVMEVSWFSSLSPGECWDSTLNEATTTFLRILYSSSSTSSKLYTQVVSATNSVVK
jgi:hypothetical protein